ncbi:MAG TPA: hypothetical protein VMX94_10090 [Armatimonadota bacterium]|nr:hypothetical protein [Armatimonadota bacterium]
MPQPETGTLSGRIYRKFLTELAARRALSENEYATVEEAVNAGTFGTEASIENTIRIIEKSDTENSNP